MLLSLRRAYTSQMTAAEPSRKTSLLTRAWRHRSRPSWLSNMAAPICELAYSPHKWPATRKMFPFDDVIMCRFDHWVTILININVLSYQLTIIENPIVENSLADNITDFVIITESGELGEVSSLIFSGEAPATLPAFDLPGRGVLPWWAAWAHKARCADRSSAGHK